MLKNLKKFLLRGNILDLAIGVIIGAAFGKIVDSLVKQIITPVIGFMSGGVNFSDRAFVMKEAVMEGEKVINQPIIIGWGFFCRTFLIFYWSESPCFFY